MRTRSMSARASTSGDGGGGARHSGGGGSRGIGFGGGKGVGERRHDAAEAAAQADTVRRSGTKLELMLRVCCFWLHEVECHYEACLQCCGGSTATSWCRGIRCQGAPVCLLVQGTSYRPRPWEPYETCL